jgi:hypothetical protein
MKNISWQSPLLKQQPAAALHRFIEAIVFAALFGTAAIAGAQEASSAPAAETQMSIPTGYTAHHSIDLGGRMSNIAGSGAMYDYMVNLQSGPRVQGESFELHALPGNKKSLVDDLTAFGSGFGGDPNIVARLTASKSKYYEFTGLFRRDRLYADYDLLANPNIPSGFSIPIGPSNAPAGALAWPQVKHSPVLFNTVRRMTDTNLTLRPFAIFSYRLAYSHSTMEGPSYSPSYTILKYNALLRQYERNGNDDFLGALDWRPSPAWKITLEMQANHYKADTFFTLDPAGFLVQEADGTPAYLGNYTSFVPYGIAACNTTSMGSAYTSSSVYTLLSPASTPGGLPIINPACAVVTSYLRTQPTRIWTPTETLRFESSAIKNVVMNGNVHYTLGNMNMPAYYENAQGLSTLNANGTANRSVIWSGGHASAERQVIGADYGIIWQASPTVSLSDQATYYSMHQPGSSIIPPQTALADPAGAGNGTVNYSGILVPGTVSLPHGINGTLTHDFLGQMDIINNAGVAWDLSSRARFSLTYRYSNRVIGQGVPHNGALTTATDPIEGQLTINENAGVFNGVVRPAKNWDLNGSVEIGYYDNAFTTVLPRQLKQYRVHTIYKAKSWATVSGSYSDRERHNNTSATSQDEPYIGPVNHVDHSRVGSVGVVLAPGEHYSLDLNYSYSDVYAVTNICYANGATTTAPGAATITSSGAPNLCPAPYASTFFARDFMDAPTQFGSVSLSYSPIDKVHANFGYTASDVNGSRFFNDSRDVNGSMVSLYQSPFADFAYTMRPGLTWKAEYNYYGYGEGGPSGAQLCSTATSATAAVVPCTTLPFPTGLTEGTAGATAPRVFHANNVALGVHYEF